MDDPRTERVAALFHAMSADLTRLAYLIVGDWALAEENGTTLDVTRKGIAVRSQDTFDGMFVESYQLGKKAPRLPSRWGAIFVTLPPARCPLPTDVVRLEVVELLNAGGASSYLAVAVIDPTLATRECAAEVPGGHSVFAVAVPPDVLAKLTGAAARLADEPLRVPPGTQ